MTDGWTDLRWRTILNFLVNNLKDEWHSGTS
jgi:hypothetical protein